MTRSVPSGLPAGSIPWRLPSEMAYRLSAHRSRPDRTIHTYEPKPEPSPVRPWYFVFLPNRVYLKRVWSDDADVTWPMRGAEGGIFKTRLLITPHGRDFEYRASGGTLKNPAVPELAVRQIYLLITKKIFTLYQLDLTSGNGSIHGEGSTAISGTSTPISSSTGPTCRFASGCPKPGVATLPAQRPAIFIGRGMITSSLPPTSRVRSM